MTNTEIKNESGAVIGTRYHNACGDSLDVYADFSGAVGTFFDCGRRFACHWTGGEVKVFDVAADSRQRRPRAAASAKRLTNVRIRCEQFLAAVLPESYREHCRSLYAAK